MKLDITFMDIVCGIAHIDITIVIKINMTRFSFEQNSIQVNLLMLTSSS